jgi:hypothetical protein
VRGKIGQLERRPDRIMRQDLATAVRDTKRVTNRSGAMLCNVKSRLGGRHQKANRKKMMI